MYVTMYACMHLCMCICVGVWELVCMYIYIICFVHMGYFVMLWGGGGREGGTVVSVYSFCILYVLLFDDFLQ